MYPSTLLIQRQKEKLSAQDKEEEEGERPGAPRERHELQRSCQVSRPYTVEAGLQFEKARDTFTHPQPHFLLKRTPGVQPPRTIWTFRLQVTYF